MSGREVTLVLCTAQGELLGATPPFDVENTWWRDVDEAVWVARGILKVDVRVLRILDMLRTSNGPCGGRVTYLAEVSRRPPSVTLHPWHGDPLAPDPHRPAYAEPGGHEQDLSWAADSLASRGIEVIESPVQVRTWNLSSVWRLPTTAGPIWLKVTPPFCASQAHVLPLLDQRIVPKVLGSGANRVLLANAPGPDRTGARGRELRTMARILVGLQATWFERVPQLEALGVLDERANAALPRIYAVVDRNQSELHLGTQRRLDSLVARLPQRFAALEACGIPDTLVHGDFHPGNVRGTHGNYRILDWGDCGIGHPMLDLRPSLEYFAPVDRLESIHIWETEWSRQVPGCDAGRAAELARPLGPLFGAVVYQKFLDNIESTERPYHEGAPARALDKAVELALGA